MGRITSAWAQLITAAAVTDTGLVRELNEDSHVCVTGLYMVADGMGGHAAGEVASGLCVEVVRQALEHRDSGRADIESAVEAANAAILSYAADHADRKGMGTTVTGLVLTGTVDVPVWTVFNLGDSRTYRLSDGRLEQLTVDHSEVEEMHQRGELTREQARTHPRRHVVTRSLGVRGAVSVDFWQLPVTAGERLLLCSDGLVDELTDAQMLSILSAAADPQVAAAALVAAAVDHGGRDNVTVVVVDVRDRHENDRIVADTVPRTAGVVA